MYGIGAGICLAISLLLWMPYLWSVLGVLLFPLLLKKNTPERRKILLTSGLTSTIVLGLFLCGAVAILHLHSIKEVSEWISASQHGDETRGALRVLFGLPRSFINMGNDAIVFKRYLLHDPYNPVTLSDLFLNSIWKIGFFYLVCICMIAAFIRQKTNLPKLILFAIGCFPVLIFAVQFDGAAVERYLPLYPFILIMFSGMIDIIRSQGLFMRKAGIAVAVAFPALCVFINGKTMNRATLIHTRTDQQNEIRPLLTVLRPGSIILTPSLDELEGYAVLNPDDSITRTPGFEPIGLAELGTKQVLQWKHILHDSSMAAWARGGDVWLWYRLIEKRPKREWNWVEGADPHIHWRDFPGLFNILDLSPSDVVPRLSFIKMSLTDHNKMLLDSAASCAVE
jgi:hypothetical protein